MNHKRNVYLKMKSLNQAREILFSKFDYLKCMDGESISVGDSCGRVLSEAVYAQISSPSYHSAAMDGVAVKAISTFGASENSPRILVTGEDAFPVNTGHKLPEGCDAVIMIEHLNYLDETQMEIEAPAFPWQYVRKVGEDIVATELLFPRNHKITPYCIGALIAGGNFQVSVRKKPRVLIIPTGSELVDLRKTEAKDVLPGHIIESNSYVLGTMAESYGAVYHRHDMVVDDLSEIKKAVGNAASGEYDIVLILGGSSAGSMDYSRPVVESLGDIYIHGVTMMPGKPVLFGNIHDKPVYGIPGYPVSAIVAFEQFVVPIILKMLGLPEYAREKIDVTPTRKIASKLGSEEFLRVKLGVVRNRIVATPLPRGSGSITSITEADGILRIPDYIEGINENEIVTADLLKPAGAIENTIVVVGSHDNTLDVISDLIKKRGGSYSVSSSHVGSMGGLMALKRGACHMAGSHLLDAVDGSYNLSYIKRYLKDCRVKVVNLVMRDQGLIVKRGNPKGIKGIADLCRKDIKFINRQAGSGTRILLDYKLNELSLNSTGITGYENDEYTHMSVAVSVLSGAADTGLGIYAAAKALDLDFIPVVTEQYDLVIDEEFFENEKTIQLLNIIKSDEFKTIVNKMGGYHLEKTGTVIL